MQMGKKLPKCGKECSKKVKGEGLKLEGRRKKEEVYKVPKV